MVPVTVVNQRTSGPVNAHLTPGPGIYFNAFIHVYSSTQGQTVTVVNQRTSGPVNTHLTPGPGIHFNAFIHVHSSTQGQTTLGDKC